MVTKGACYVCMSSSELHTLQKAFTDAGGKWSTFIIWAKNTFTLGRADYQRQYEPILYGWKQGADHFWCGARDQGDVWFVDKPRVNDLHPTMKPVELIERAIRNSPQEPGHRPGPVRRLGHDADRCRTHRALGAAAGTGSQVCRRHRRALAEPDWQAAVLDGEDRTYDDLRTARGQEAVRAVGVIAASLQGWRSRP